MKFKGVVNNSTIRVIGSLFRRLDGSDWQINIKLMPGQEKQCFGVSQLPVLARRRILNSTDQYRPAGFQSIITIKSTSHWTAGRIKTCPIAAVCRQDDAQQWCFVFDHNGVTYHLPQLELARVLFFHHAYLARLSLINQGLAQEFDVLQTTEANKAQVNILPTCTLPLYVRGDHALRRVLAWILLDDDARRSFESIARYQLQSGYDTEKYRLWCFQFDPPLLEGVELTVRGHFDQKLQAFFVYEVHGISHLVCNASAAVEFIDPRFVEKRSGSGRAVLPGSLSVPELEVDDDQAPDADHSEMRLDAPMVSFEFANPVQTTRIGKLAGGGRGIIRVEDGASPSSEARLEVSTEEASVQGTLASADYDGLDDQSDDAHLYAGKFEAFEAMVALLVNMPDCRPIRQEIRKLPPIAGYSKHLLVDGNPRCLFYSLLEKSGVLYALLEADTSDSQNHLSTLLLKLRVSAIGWERQLHELEILLVKLSLVWPTSFLEKTFRNDYKRISHPKTSSLDKSLVDRDSFHRWAERIHSELLAL